MLINIAISTSLLILFCVFLKSLYSYFKRRNLVKIKNVKIHSLARETEKSKEYCAVILNCMEFDYEKAKNYILSKNKFYEATKTKNT